MGYSDSSKSVGLPSLDLGLEIVATVLDLIQAGWEVVVTSGEVTRTSLEPDIAGRLGREMLTEKRKRGIKNLRIEEDVGTRSSLDAPKVKGRIDIKVIYSFDEEEYFGIECKRVGGLRKGELAGKYVTDGVSRFVTGKYSPRHEWGAMVGFVIDGKRDEAVKLVIQKMRANRKVIATTEEWSVEKRFGSHEYLYRTRHCQVHHTNHITILHLFLNLPVQGTSMGKPLSSR